MPVGKLDYKNLSISPKYHVNDWKTAKDINDWNLMTDIFIDRIDGRYLKPIRLISKDSAIGEYSGFTILAIDCLFIETLNQFYNGHDETQGKHNKAFWNFFKQSDFFKSHFSRQKAFIFYSHFRCGILHQAQTKAMSVVRIDQNQMVQNVTSDISDGLIIDRLLFHEALENELSSYVNKLKNGNKKLCDNFKIKMDLICGI
jgi:hypothetical protein